MDEFELHAIATKSVKGVFALVSRSFLLQLLGVATSFILTLFLDPASFGVFFVVSSIIVFFNYFQDIGLAASLIQKKEDPSIAELRTVFFCTRTSSAGSYHTRNDIFKLHCAIL